MKLRLLSFLILFVGLFQLPAFCQMERGGTPRSFLVPGIQKSKFQAIRISSPDMLLIEKEDAEASRLEKPYRVGIDIPVSISSAKDGQWDELPQGGRVWRVSVNCQGARAIGLNYSDLYLPAGCDLFVYTPDQHVVLGAFTNNEINTANSFVTRPLSGEEIVVELYEPPHLYSKSVLAISSLSYVYRGFEPFEMSKAGKSIEVSCEVNVNCQEGQDWQSQKRGVVKIYTKVASSYFWCTGTILNNTNQDFSSLLLTASHCSTGSGSVSSDDDYTKWVFYFNFESPGCMDEASQQYTVAGAQKLAISDNSTDIGSDFLLLRLLSEIPANFKPYYCGWDAGDGNSSSGVGIHHPNGEIKKISTYTSLLGSGTWGSTPNTHWIVQWAETANGHGVTEPGSSGSPVFDNEGLVIGSLTGGQSSCSNTSGEDFYGKFSFSWLSNGNTAERQLKSWLDPGNTGILKMPGTFNEKLASAEFSANSFVIPVGGSIDFLDFSSGKPDRWHWYFQGGKPSESTVQNPTGIRFDSFGFKNVKLVVSNAYNSDSIVKEEYIDVKAVVSPNPSTGTVNVLTDINNENDVLIEVYTSSGVLAQRYKYSGSASASYPVQLPEWGNVFLVRVIHGSEVQTNKVIVVR